MVWGMCITPLRISVKAECSAGAIGFSGGRSGVVMTV